jgi:hypothetical protein
VSPFVAVDVIVMLPEAAAALGTKEAEKLAARMRPRCPKPVDMAI